MPGIVAKMATFPARFNECKRAIESILPQVGLLTVYCNQYDEPPSYLVNRRNIEILTGEDLGDGGKLVGTVGDQYTFLVDDDIIYPPDYVAKLRGKINHYGLRRIVGCHAAILPATPKSYFGSRKTQHFAEKRHSDCCVNVLGTGTLAFAASRLCLSDIQPVHKNMLDVYFAAECQKREIPMVSISRARNWLKSIPTRTSLWLAKGSGEQQAEIVRSVRPWKIFE